jgi:hypothetical protein
MYMAIVLMENIGHSIGTIPEHIQLLLSHIHHSIVTAISAHLERRTIHKMESFAAIFSQFADLRPNHNVACAKTYQS